MSTQQPSTPSQSDPTSMSEEEAAAALLPTIHKELEKFKVDPDVLLVVFLGDTEMVLGELLYDEEFEKGGKTHPSIFQVADYVAIENPKRLTRLQLVNRETNQIALQIQFGDFDMISNGVIEVKPTGGFFLDWCDYATQLRYCKGYLNFLEGKRRASARAAGLVLPNGG